MVLLTDVYRNLPSLWIKPREHAFKQFKSPVLNVLRLSYLVLSLHWNFRSMRSWLCQTHFGIVPRNVLNRSRLTVIRLDVMDILEMSRECASSCGIAVMLWNSQGVMPFLQWRNDVVKLAFEARVYDIRPQNARARLHSDERRMCYYRLFLFLLIHSVPSKSSFRFLLQL